MGARGIQGHCFQFFRGFAKSVGKAEKLGIPEISKVVGAANLAYQAVRKPVEGTILTVIREAGQKRRRSRGKKDLIKF